MVRPITAQERRVTEIVRQRDGLGQPLVDVQCDGQPPGDFRDLQRVGQSRAKVVVLVVDENLGLVLKTPERRTGEHAMTVYLERIAKWIGRFIVHAAERVIGTDGTGPESLRHSRRPIWTAPATSRSRNPSSAWGITRTSPTMAM